MNATSGKYNLRLAVVIWLFGMFGVVPLILLLPSMFAGHQLPVSFLVFSLIQLLQSGILVAMAAFIGVKLAPKVGLHSPVLEALTNWQPLMLVLRPQVVPGLIGGIVVGVLLIGMSYVTPHELTIAAQTNLNPWLKVITEVLYGGITEEILLRWGIMTLLLWLLWRFIQHNQQSPSSMLIWIAIMGSSLFFAIGHLPAALNLAGYLTPNIIAYVITGNASAGIVFGFLYQRFGLESAIIAHAGAHIIADIVSLF